MKWTAVSEALPSGAALVYAEGALYVAVLVDDGTDQAFMELHTCDLLPWPSHWMDLPPPPGPD